MSDELKPCPHCGGKPRVYGNDLGNKEWIARCTNLMSCGHRGSAWMTEAEAVNAWNRRAAPQPPAAMPVPPAGAHELIEQLVACHDEPTCPVVALAKEWLAAAQPVPATGAQPWQKPGPVTVGHPLECLIVVESWRQSDGDWWVKSGSTFLGDDTPIAWMADTPENRAMLAGAPPAAPTGSAG